MKNILVFAMVSLLLISCGSEDKRELLESLEKQRDDLNNQIDELRAKLDLEKSNTPDGRMTAVSLSQLTLKPFMHYIKIQGMVESDNNVLIPARTFGVIKKIFVEKGQEVKKGQLLAAMDGAILENSLSELEINMELAKTMYERQKRLWGKKIGSEVQFLQAKTNKDALEKRMAATREQYMLTKVIAPISGTVDEIMIKEGEAVNPGFGTIRIVKLSDLKITANLSEKYTGRIRRGDSIIVSIPVLSRDFIGIVRSVARVINPKNRTFPIEVSLPKDITRIQPNMLTVLLINDYSNPEAITVPFNIIQKTEFQRFCFAASKDKNDIWTVERRMVEIGLKYSNQVEILNGLEPGEFVVIKGFQNLGGNQKVIVSSQNEN